MNQKTKSKIDFGLKRKIQDIIRITGSENSNWNSFWQNSPTIWQQSLSIIGWMLLLAKSEEKYESFICSGTRAEVQGNFNLGIDRLV